MRGLSRNGSDAAPRGKAPVLLDPRKPCQTRLQPARHVPNPTRFALRKDGTTLAGVFLSGEWVMGPAFVPSETRRAPKQDIDPQRTDAKEPKQLTHIYVHI